MVERIDSLRDEASAAIAAAGDSDELEQLRVHYLGRKSELTPILRGIAELEPAERGPVGSGANAARKALEAELEARDAELDATELERSLVAGAIDVTLPGAPPPPTAAQNLLIRTQREIEDVFVGLGYRVIEGPEVELDYYNFTALNHPPGHPARMAQDTLLRRPVDACPTDVVNERAACRPGPRGRASCARTPRRCRCGRWRQPGAADLQIVCPGRCYRRDPIDATHSPIFHQVEGLAVGEDITLADLEGTLDARRPGDLRARAARRGSSPASSRSPSPAWRWTSPAFAVAARARCPTARATRSARASAGSRSSAPGMVDPNVFGFVRANGYDPERVQGFAFGMGIERIAMLKHGIPDLRMFFENDVRVLGAVLRSRRSPVKSLLADRVLRSRPLGRGDRRAALDARVEVERISHVGVAVARRASSSAASSRPSSTRTPTGCASARSTPATGRGRSSAARRTSPPGRRSRSRCPARCCPTGTKLGKAKLRGVESNGMILSERELEHRRRRTMGSWCSQTGPAPGTPLGEVFADLRAGARARPEPEPGRLHRRLRRRARGARDHRRRARAARRGTTTPRRRGEGSVEDSPRSRSRSRTSARGSPPACSPTSTIGPSPPWLQGAAHGRRACGRSPTSSTSPTT